MKQPGRSKKNLRRAGPALTLPANPEPPDTICIPVELPYDFANPTDSLWWIATFTGQLRRLGYRFEYQGGETDTAFRTARTWRTVVDQIHARSLAGVYCDDLDQPVEGEGCYSIGPFHPAISYFPNHPILTPDYIAPGYSAPAWVDEITLPGYQAGDTLINPLSLNLFADIADLLESGVPSWTLNFSGAGEIDVTFMSQLQGGMVWIFPDNNPLVGDLIDLNWRDLSDFGTTTILFEFLEIISGDPGIFEVEYSVNFETTGPHTLTAWYIPVGDTEAPWVGIGGGLRRIELCGQITVEDDAVMPYTIERSGCDILLKLDDVTVSTIEDVFYTDATCDITGVTHIRFPASGTSNHLQLTNTDAAPTENTGTAILMRGHDAALTQRLQAYAIANWDNAALTEGRMRIGVGLSGVLNDIIRLNSSNIAATVFHQPTLGHSHTLKVLRTDSVFNTNHALEVVNLSTYLGGITWEGQLQAFKRHTVANSPTNALLIQAFASGVTPAAGFGGAIDFNGQSSANNQRSMARIKAIWANATDAARQGQLDFSVSNQAGEVTPLKLTNADGLTAIAVHGQTPKTRPTLTGTGLVAVLNDLLGHLDEYGWIVDDTTITLTDGEASAGFGDVNQAPETFADPCGAANSLVEFVRDTIATGFNDLVAGATAQERYLYFRERYGWKLDELYTFVTTLQTNDALAVDIVDEIDDFLADLVIIFFENDLEQSAIAAAVLTSSLSNETQAVLATCISALTLAQWREEGHVGSVFGLDTYSCIGCAGGGPVEGEFVVQWTGDNGGLAADWTTGDCGVGFTSEINCDGEDAALYLLFDIPAPPALTLEFVRFEIEITYDFNANRSISCSMSSDGDTLSTDPETLSGVGSFTFISTIGIITTNTGNQLGVSLISTSVFSIGDEFTVVSIRVEGNGNNFEHSGDQC